jgi:hypothetical protein
MSRFGARPQKIFDAKPQWDALTDGEGRFTFSTLAARGKRTDFRADNPVDHGAGMRGRSQRRQ